MNTGYGKSYIVGYGSNIWFRVSLSDASAYDLYAHATEVYSSNGDNRWYGLPLHNHTIFQLPLAFVRSGLVDTNLGHSRDRGSHGFGWSRVPQSTTAIYLLYTGSTGATPSYYDYCWRGFSLRFIILHLPLAFVRSGNLGLHDGQVWNAGLYGYEWSKNTKTEINAYDIYSYSASVNSLDSSGRWYGFPLRASTIVQLPLAFVRSGYVDLNVGISYDVGSYGYGWSRVSRSATNAYRLRALPTDINLSDGNVRWYGFPLHAHHRPVALSFCAEWVYAFVLITS